MTIAVTGNRIVDAQARRGKARADAEDRKKAGKAKNSGKSKSRGGSARARTNSKARAGRKAAKSARGRGIAGSVHKSRSGGGASIAYAMDKPESKFISSNAGLKSKDIAQLFKLAGSSRPGIEKNTGHESFSLPPGQKLSDEKWADIIDLVRQEKGLDDGFPFVAALHEDTDHQHAHFVFSRVSYDGRVVDDRFSKVRMATIEDMIEDRFNLKLVPKPPTPTAPIYSKNEAELAQRTGMKPPRFLMFDVIAKAKKDKPDVMTFIARLKSEGVTARPAIRNGKMSGFSFAHNGVELGASKIHNGLGWANLQKGLNYEPDSDDSKLAQHAASLAPRGEAVEPEPVAINREIPIAGGRAKVAEPEPSALEAQTARPDKPARRAEVSKASPFVVGRGADDHVVGGSDVLVSTGDPIAKKMRARQDIIDRLRKETGDRHKLAQELAQRIERGDLYRQRQIVKSFAEDHKDDPKAVAILKEHMPELVPATPHVRPRDPAQELPERLRLAERYQEPTPQNPADHLPGPGM